VNPATAWWAQGAPALLQALGSGPQGLSRDEAQARLRRDGPNAVAPSAELAAWTLLVRQFSGPLVLILLAGAGIALALGEWMQALTIATIVAGSAAIGFAQEWRASRAVRSLRSRLALTARVWRDARVQLRLASEIVAGDVVELAAGNLVPADGVVLEARDFLVTQASLTGESLPVEKRPGVAAPDAPLSERSHCVHLGSSVRSGTARVLIVRTGRDTLLAGLSARIAARAPETSFARGVRHFGEMLLRVMLVVVVAVLVANQFLGRPVVDSLLFAVALGVGLSPELLPAIVSVSLARGARELAASGVLVRRLEAIEDLGVMNVLCTDKTGTLTEGAMTLAAASDPQGEPSLEVLRLAHLNAAFETGIDNPLDAAIVQAGTAAGLDASAWTKVDEIPYDFVRRRLTIVVEKPGDTALHLLVTKGAFDPLLACCTRVAAPGGGAPLPLDAAAHERLAAHARAQGEAGVRVLGLASRRIEAQPHYDARHETALVFEGFLCFSDPPRASAAVALAHLRGRGVALKMVTGDNRHVAAHVARAVGLDAQAMLTGAQITALRDEALWHLAPRTDLFVEVDPSQKERIVRALQRTGHAVGYLGDGINDAPALHAADVGISVDQAVDVARESADVVLLRPDLDVLRRGVEDGRRTFANTLKYIRITTSANFGNMTSMALATPLLPFLPLTAMQILLNNFLSDLPAMTLSTDRVDAPLLRHAQTWDLASMRRFMLVFGLLSSIFDLLAFALLLHVFHAPQALFQGAWFVVSLLTELVALLVLRTHGAFWRSRPAPLLVVATVAVAALAWVLPAIEPVASLMGLVPMPPAITAAMLALVAGYVVCTEAVKRWFFRSPPHRARARAARSAGPPDQA
jgi:Mg2+-importing ATPase